MMKPDADTLELLGWIQTEIGAGKVMFPKSDAEHAHNNACDRADTIISNYRDGIGLFQITNRKTSAAPAGAARQQPKGDK